MVALSAAWKDVMSVVLKAVDLVVPKVDCWVFDLADLKDDPRDESTVVARADSMVRLLADSMELGKVDLLVVMWAMNWVYSMVDWTVDKKAETKAAKKVVNLAVYLADLMAD